MRAVHHHGDHALADLAVSHLLANRANDPRTLIPDDVRPRRHLAAGTMQRVAALDADCADVDEDTGRVADRVGHVFVTKYLGTTGLIVHRCFHAPLLFRSWLRIATRLLPSDTPLCNPKSRG